MYVNKSSIELKNNNDLQFSFLLAINKGEKYLLPKNLLKVSQSPAILGNETGLLKVVSGFSWTQSLTIEA